MVAATLIRGNLAEELTKLKQQPGKDVQVIGSPPWSGRCCARACCGYRRIADAACSATTLRRRRDE